MYKKNPPINLDELKKIARHQWTDEMLAGHFGCSGQTIRRRYGEIIDAARLEGKSSIIDALWIRAKASDKILEHVADRFLGKIPTKVELSNEELTHLVDQKLNSEPKEET